MEEPEPTTIRAAAKGDPAAFERLVRSHQAPVFRFLRHLVGDRTAAEDLTQETFLRLYRNLGSFRFQAKFTTWLFQVARNAATDELRRAQRRARLLELAPAPGPPSAPDDRVELRAALAALPVAMREPLVLVEVFGFTYVEVAAVLDVPVGTVKSRVFHARQRLHAWRQDHGEGDRAERGATDEV
ncbi:MAG: RNA polymerase sigma factor [Acidimicrobiales bacterium]